MSSRRDPAEAFELHEIDHDEVKSTVIHVAQGVQEFNNLRNSITRDGQPPSEVEAGKIGSSDPSSQDFTLEAFFEDSIRSGLVDGYKPKRVGLVFKNVTVVGESAATTSISDNLTPLKKTAKLLWPPNWVKKRSSNEIFDILHDISGYVKDGEMLLVLGRPGSGCSTFLRTIANERENYVDTTGEIRYGGIDAKEFGKYRGEAVYIPEEDFHFPTLTVEQTIDFALKMRDPTKIWANIDADTQRQRIRDVLLRMFGLTKQAHTIVGDQLIRGISGGERKRLTIAEAMVSHGSIECWDCTTRGLDSASALDYARSLKLMTTTLKKSCVATFYQASESIYKLFDKVLVLEKGRCVYFGPTSEAKQYFLDLGFECEARKSTPDFVTGICNPTERKIRPGFEDSAPLTSFALETAWKNSKAYASLNKEIASYEADIEGGMYKDFPQAVKSMKVKGVVGYSKFGVTKRQQLGALVTRQSQIVKGGMAQIISMYIGTIISAIIFGSLFYQIPLDAMGGFTRSGALFMSVMFNSMINSAELPKTYDGRSVISKHKSYAFYHAGIGHLARIVLDWPVALIQAILYSCIAYWMFGLHEDGSKFFLFVFIVFLQVLTFTDFLRLIGNVTKSLFLGQQVLNVAFVCLLLYCGYFLPQNKMPVWLAWLQWINPFGYGFKSMFSNEMRGLTFDCSEFGSVPYGPSYNDSAYKTCQLPGSTRGSPFVRGEDYLQEAYGLDTQYLGLYVLGLGGLWLFYVILNIILVEVLDHAKGGFIRKVYKGGNAPQMNDEKSEIAQQKVVEEAQKNLGTHLTLIGGVFSWSEMKYTVPVKEGKRLLLDNVEGWIKPGQMTALMGASGAGKTTLLDVLAQRKTAGKVEGTILLNGSKIRKDFERITGYVEQMDVHDPYLTVREALRFSAVLRQDASISRQEKYEYVERVLEMMEMNHMGDALIGSLEEGVGISVEERKRLTIGMELVAKPHILFLDEPTSGLDAQSAYNIIKFIRKLSDAGMPLVCTIHQPSSVLFEYFDRLLLLAKGGKTVYFGDIGKSSQVMVDYFVKNGARACTAEENPAEYLLEVTGAGISGHTDIDWAEAWKSSEERAKVEQELKRIQSERVEAKEPAKEFATGYLRQTWELYKRLNLVWWRNPEHNVARFFQAAIVGLGLGLSFWDLGRSSSDLMLMVLAALMFLMLVVQLMLQSQAMFFRQRDLFRRDYASKFYSWAPFSFCMIFVELPYLTGLASVCILIAYWMIGLDTTAGAGVYFWINFVIFVFFSISFAQLIAAIAPSLIVALQLLPVFSNMLTLFAGVVVAPSVMPKFWRSWLYWINPFHYFLEGQVVNVLVDVKVECAEEDFFRFGAPPGINCSDYTKEFFEMGARGYLQDGSATDECAYCEYTNGKDFYEPFDWDYSHRWRNFGIVIGFWCFNMLLSCLLIYLNRKPKR